MHELSYPGYYTCLADCLPAFPVGASAQGPLPGIPLSYKYPRSCTGPWAATPAAVPIPKPCYWLSELAGNTRQQKGLKLLQTFLREVSSAGMVGKQGVAAPVSSRFWDSCASYISFCIIV
jgi:hypothetical protein